ncbi:hypothetical protein Gotur_003109 [Gossypium turneri]
MLKGEFCYLILSCRKTLPLHLSLKQWLVGEQSKSEWIGGGNQDL